MAGTFNASKVKVGVGSLYAAPLGTTEPVSVTAPWAAGWVSLGYTDAGSEFTLTPSATEIAVEEEYWPVAVSIQAYAGTLAFALAEATASNLALSLNLGITPAAASQAANPDGSIWTEPPSPTLEVPIMLGWDALPKGGTAGDPFMRLIVRNVLQTGAVRMVHRKGNNKLMYEVSYMIIKPATQQPFRIIQPAVLT